MIEHIEKSLQEAHAALCQLQNNKQTLHNIAKAAEALVHTFTLAGKVYSCGNGGSMCDAMHFAEELTGRYRKNRPPIAATAISDPGHISCVANDFGYDEVFSRYVESHLRKEDCLVAMSTSGKSPNIIKAAQAAQKVGATVIALTGKENSELEAFANICICTPGGQFADRVQELHIKVLHILIELIERKLYPENYEA